MEALDGGEVGVLDVALAVANAVEQNVLRGLADGFGGRPRGAAEEREGELKLLRVGLAAAERAAALPAAEGAFDGAELGREGAAVVLRRRAVKAPGAEAVARLAEERFALVP